ncbi:NAD(P)-binding protein [Microthyrium microscopicum]|uniref:NAD(P)-binding protein n=1 Tax=Microthyrium microscopicum TaxID=703497 RepID=A0A6A6U5U3_9PEZI|nr:NAD(P)-binding protein [Microthyrium microscopicum]
MTRLLIVLGSGPGIGVGVASHFASSTFTHIALVARTASRLSTDVSSVQAAAEHAGKQVTVKAYPADLADTASLTTALESIKNDFGAPEVVIYNAARTGKSGLFEVDEERVLSDYKVTTLGLYTAAKILAPQLASLAKEEGRSPALIVTSGGLYKTPYHPFFSLAQSKASQHNLTMSLAQKLAPEGIHVCAIIVHGLVKPESEIFSPANIAKTYWKVYEEGVKGEREVWITDGKGWTPTNL